MEVVVVAMSGEEICKIYVTTDAWSLIYRIQKLSESDMPGKDLAKAYLMGDQFFIAFHEKVGGCLRVPSCSIQVMEVTCNGIGVASRAMTSRTYDHELCSPSKAHQRVLYGASLHSCIAARKSDMREPHCGI